MHSTTQCTHVRNKQSDWMLATVQCYYSTQIILSVHCIGGGQWAYAVHCRPCAHTVPIHCSIFFLCSSCPSNSQNAFCCVWWPGCCLFWSIGRFDIIDLHTWVASARTEWMCCDDVCTSTIGYDRSIPYRIGHTESRWDGKLFYWLLFHIIRDGIWLMARPVAATRRPKIIIAKWLAFVLTEGMEKKRVCLPFDCES